MDAHACICKPRVYFLYVLPYIRVLPFIQRTFVAFFHNRKRAVFVCTETGGGDASLLHEFWVSFRWS